MIQSSSESVPQIPLCQVSWYQSSSQSVPQIPLCQMSWYRAQVSQSHRYHYARCPDIKAQVSQSHRYHYAKCPDTELQSVNTTMPGVLISELKSVSPTDTTMPGGLIQRSSQSIPQIPLCQVYWYKAQVGKSHRYHYARCPDTELQSVNPTDTTMPGVLIQSSSQSIPQIQLCQVSWYRAPVSQSHRYHYARCPDTELKSVNPTDTTMPGVLIQSSSQSIPQIPLCQVSWYRAPVSQSQIYHYTRCLIQRSNQSAPQIPLCQVSWYRAEANNTDTNMPDINHCHTYLVYPLQTHNITNT